MEEYYKQPGNKSPLHFLFPDYSQHFGECHQLVKDGKQHLGGNLDDILAEDEAIDTLEALRETQRYGLAPGFCGRNGSNYVIC